MYNFVQARNAPPPHIREQVQQGPTTQDDPQSLKQPTAAFSQSMKKFRHQDGQRKTSAHSVNMNPSMTYHDLLQQVQPTPGNEKGIAKDRYDTDTSTVDGTNTVASEPQSHIGPQLLSSDHSGSESDGSEDSGGHETQEQLESQDIYGNSYGNAQRYGSMVSQPPIEEVEQRLPLQEHRRWSSPNRGRTHLPLERNSYIPPQPSPPQKPRPQLSSQAVAPSAKQPAESLPTSSHLPVHTQAPYHTDPIAHHDPEEPVSDGSESVDEAEYDYHPDVLTAKSYDQLKEARFDFSPSDDAEDVFATQRNIPVVERVSQGYRQPKRAQMGLFARMTIDEWDEAGDWFVDQFSEVMKRYRGLRREKRKLALELEGEIERRHDQVEKKRKTIDSALNEMKSNGGKVLQCTPRRMRVG